VYAYRCAQLLYTTQHRIVLIIFTLNLHTNIIAWMQSIGGRGLMGEDTAAEERVTKMTISLAVNAECCFISCISLQHICYQPLLLTCSLTSQLCAVHWRGRGLTGKDTAAGELVTKTTMSLAVNAARCVVSCVSLQRFSSQPFSAQNARNVRSCCASWAESTTTTAHCQ